MPAKKTTPKKTPAKKAAVATRSTKPAPRKKAAAKKAAPRRRRPAKPDARDSKVLELRRAGMAFDVIATQLKFATPEAAADAFERAFAATLPQPADEQRRLELDRLERLMTPLWPKAQRGDLACVRELARLSEQRTRLAAEDAPLTAALPTDRDKGAVERDTEQELIRLNRLAHPLASSALVLARCIDGADSNAVAAATGVRELRQTMRALAALAPMAHTASGETKSADPVVVEQNRLAELRERNARRGRTS